MEKKIFFPLLDARGGDSESSLRRTWRKEKDLLQLVITSYIASIIRLIGLFIDWLVNNCTFELIEQSMKQIY